MTSVGGAQSAGRARLSVREHPGGRPALVCLHGLASNARWWDLVARQLSPRFRIVAPDARGPDAIAWCPACDGGSGH